MIGTRKNKQKSPSFRKVEPSFGLMGRETANLAEHFMGRREDGEFYNVTGGQLHPDCVVLQTYAADPFKVLLKLGENWVQVAAIQPGDPALEELDLTEYGPSPAQMEKQRRKDEEDRKRIEAEQAVEEERRQAHIARLHKEQEKAESRRQSRREAMGW